MEYKTRKIVKPADLNSQNTLFGGRIMEWLDEECAIFAICQLKTTNIVTKIIGEADFKSPARQGDIIEIGADVVKFGRTSLVVRAEIRNFTTKQIILTLDKIVFVTVDEDGNSVPHGIS
jgi:acyl-CoA thioesterase YciA